MTDAATASRTMLLDLDAVRVVGRRRARRSASTRGTLPRVADCAGVVGETTVFGDRPLPVAGIAVDQQAALYAHGCVRPGDAKCTYGTGAFLLVTTGEKAARSSRGPVRVGRLAAGRRHRVLPRRPGLHGRVRAALAGRDRRPARPGRPRPRGGHRRPTPAASRSCPRWPASARRSGRRTPAASWPACTLSTRRGHIARAVAEGIAASVALLAEAAAADLGGPLTALRVDGGLTRSRVLLQAQADLLQLPVLASRTPDATALGVAALARLALGERQAASPPGRGRADRAPRHHPRCRPRERISRYRHALASHPVMSWDVAIIGGGVVGTAIARELAGYQLRCVLLEAADDVGAGTSKANTAILHTGFDATPGTLESRLVARGSALLREYAERAGIAVERTGALLVAWTAEQAGSLDAIAGKSRANGYTRIRSVAADRDLPARAEPRAGRGRRAVDSRRVGHRPVVGLARVRDRGGPRGRDPAARRARHRGVGRWATTGSS